MKPHCYSNNDTWLYEHTNCNWGDQIWLNKLWCFSSVLLIYSWVSQCLSTQSTACTTLEIKIAVQCWVHYWVQSPIHSPPHNSEYCTIVPLVSCVSDENQNTNTGYEILFQLMMGIAIFMKDCYMVWWYRNRAVGMKLMQSLRGKHASGILCPDLTWQVDFAETMETENGNGNGNENTERKKFALTTIQYIYRVTNFHCTLFCSFLVRFLHAGQRETEFCSSTIRT